APIESAGPDARAERPARRSDLPVPADRHARGEAIGTERRLPARLPVLRRRDGPTLSRRPAPARAGASDQPGSRRPGIRPNRSGRPTPPTDPSAHDPTRRGGNRLARIPVHRPHAVEPSQRPLPIAHSGPADNPSVLEAVPESS